MEYEIHEEGCHHIKCPECEWRVVYKKRRWWGRIIRPTIWVCMNCDCEFREKSAPEAKP